MLLFKIAKILRGNVSTCGANTFGIERISLIILLLTKQYRMENLVKFERLTGYAFIFYSIENAYIRETLTILEVFLN